MSEVSWFPFFFVSHNTNNRILCECMMENKQLSLQLIFEFGVEFFVRPLSLY